MQGKTELHFRSLFSSSLGRINTTLFSELERDLLACWDGLFGNVVRIFPFRNVILVVGYRNNKITNL